MEWLLVVAGGGVSVFQTMGCVVAGWTCGRATRLRGPLAVVRGVRRLVALSSSRWPKLLHQYQSRLPVAVEISNIISERGAARTFVSAASLVDA
jgi:hypothetical protein